MIITLIYNCFSFISSVIIGEVSTYFHPNRKYLVRIWHVITIFVCYLFDPLNNSNAIT